MATCHAEHAHVVGEQPGERQVVDGRDQLSRRQVTAGAEDDQRGRVGERLLDVLGERVSGRRGDAHARSTSREGTEGWLPSSASSKPGQQGGAANARLPPVAGEADLGALADARKGEPPRHLDRGAEEQVPGHRDATPDHDLVGIEGVERVGDPDPEALT